MSQRVWTTTEVKRLREYRAQKKTYAEIAVLLDRTSKGVSKQAQRLNLVTHKAPSLRPILSPKDRRLMFEDDTGAAGAIWKLRYEQCRYLIGEDKYDMHFCEETKKVGSYCEKHAKQCRSIDYWQLRRKKTLEAA